MSEDLYLAMDLGGTNCRAGLVGLNGRVRSMRRMATPDLAKPRDFVSALADFCRLVMGDVEVQSFGLGVPGAVEATGRVAFSPNLPQLNGLPLAAELQDLLGMPVRVVNDANAIAVGEACYGAGRELDSFLTITLGTGVGGGLILRRRLWEGPDGTAGEVGHLMVEAEGRPCTCGSRGCLEQYASGPGLVLTYRELATGVPGAGAAGPASGEEVARAAESGDAIALGSLGEAGRRLGQVIAGVANLLNIDGVIITGGASAHLPLMLPALHQELHLRVFATAGRRLAIQPGMLGDGAGLLGAARLAAMSLAPFTINDEPLNP